MCTCESVSGRSHGYSQFFRGSRRTRWQGALRETLCSVNVYACAHVCACVCACGHMRRTRVPSISPKPGKFQGVEEGLLPSHFAQTATAIQMKGEAWKANNNNNNNNKPTPSLWAQEAQQAPSRMWKGVYPRFRGVFCPLRSASLFSVLALRGEQGKMPPGPFRELRGEVGAEIGA